MNKKILNNNNINQTIRFLKKNNKRIVLCHGVFDLVHVGHIKHFEEAKKNGDILIVSVTSDKYVKKGLGRPVFNIHDRILSLSSLSLVNFVTVSDSVSANKVIKNIKPDVYFKGKDYKVLSKDPTKNIILEKREVEKYGGKIVFSSSELNSSSKLLFQNNMIFPEHVTKFLSSLKKKY